MNAANLTSWAPLANHVWQSTIFAAVIWLLALALKKNRAAVRYRLWLAASVKFLIPFSALVALGTSLSWRTAALAVQPQWSYAIDNAIQPFAAPTATAQNVPTHAPFNFAPILIAIWLCGVTVGLLFWLKCWTQMCRARRNATPLPLGLPIPVLSSPSQIEPGVFGILKSVLLLPAGIESRLTLAQLDAILAHEMAHVRRRDNLTAAIHMLVETVFWFFPLVWWLRARLIEERELACDEEVLRLGSEPHIYAEGILNVCKFYVSSLLACASGVTGSDLKRRIEAIVAHRAARNLDTRRRILLSAGAALALIGPIAVGAFAALPRRAQVRAETITPEFDAASVKPHHDTGARDRTRTIDPERIDYRDVSLLELILTAYGVRYYQVSGPDWLGDNRYDIVATAGRAVGVEEVKRMLGPLLAERFHLVFHRETRQLPVFALVVAKGGPKFKQPGDGGDFTTTDDGNGGLFFKNVSMNDLAAWLSLPSLGRPVIDRTGLSGTFSFDANPFGVESGSNAKTTMLGFDALDSLRAALPDQLGLKLDAQTAPIEMLVIDHADKVPTEN